MAQWHQSGYGFVDAVDGRRVYVHHTAFGGGDLEVGERVTVDVVPDQRNAGKFMAQWLIREGEEVPNGVPSRPERDEAALYKPATVIEWHEDRGYGFVELADARRVYVHHSFFGGGHLVVGGSCEVIVVPDQVNPGKWSATSLRGAAVAPRNEEEPTAKRPRV